MVGIALFFLFCLSLPAAQPKALFYITASPNGVRSFIEHAGKIDIIVPTWYSVNADGLVWGGPDPLVLETARAHHVEVMPIVSNPGFNQADFHRLLADETAQFKMIPELIGECKKYGYSGFQFDFEHVSWTDRDGLSSLVIRAADIFHRNGFKLSIATVPNVPGYPGAGGFARWIYENWRGAYDLQKIGAAVDFLCLMTYDEHTSYTPPGPVAGYPWTVENLQYALQVVPKEKLSLGIPLYGRHWFASAPGKDDKPTVSAASISAPDAVQLAKTYHAAIEWDSTARAAWFYFYRDETREWVFFTDERSFRERLDLVRQNTLQGFCSWVLGEEDPAIWNLLPERK
ncbi:MAG: glycosyl hydrolase family 18 protein [Bryobacteraceae bacterium]